MIKPGKLHPGDTIATISLSWGGAGDLPHRYQVGKRQLESEFGVKVIETPNALKSSDWIYRNPQARADDLIWALENPEVKAIISNIGGEDSVRTLKFIQPDIIRNNPKIFLGFSDSTVAHFCFYKAGVTSFYGTSLLVGFAENGGMHAYQVDDINKRLFQTETSQLIEPNPDGWTSERLEWTNPDNQNTLRKLTTSNGWNWLQGQGVVSGELLGGCLDVLEFLKDTDYWVRPEDWKGKIMFIETSEDRMEPDQFRWIIRNYAASGILHNINGLLVGRPYDNVHCKEYNETLLKVIRDEEGLDDLPIITEMDFGHTCPTFTIPYGIEAELNCDQQSFRLLESGVS